MPNIYDYDPIINISKTMLIPVRKNNSNYNIEFDRLVKSNIDTISPNIDYKLYMVPGEYKTYYLSNPDTFSNYVVSAISGNVTLSKDTVDYNNDLIFNVSISYTAPQVTGPAGFILNGKRFEIEIVNPVLLKPTILTPINNEQIAESSLEIIASDASFLNNIVESNVKSYWEISTVNDFSTIEHSYYDYYDAKWNPPTLAYNTTYYTRMRYKSAHSEYSEWSDTVTFITKDAPFIEKPIILTPANNAIDQERNVSLSTSAFVILNKVDNLYAITWQFSLTSDFSIIESTEYSYEPNVTLVPTSLIFNTTYYVRAKFVSNSSGDSLWSDIVSFSTKAGPYVEAPVITYPTNNAIDLPLSVLATSGTFTVVGDTDTHYSTDWQLAYDSGFTNLRWAPTNQITDKTSFNFTSLTQGATYYLRARYKGANYGKSAWGEAIAFTIVEIKIDKPTILTPVNNTTNVETVINITSSAFAMTPVGTSNTHVSTDWELSTDINFSTTVYQSLANTTNKTSLVINGNIYQVSPNTSYYIRVRYNGSNTSYGSSAWSEPIKFTTSEVFLPLTEKQIINIGDLTASSFSGWAISMDELGDRIAIGAYKTDVASVNDAGAVYIFVKSGTTWVQEAKLVDNVLVAADYFGNAVAINKLGDRVVIGEYQKDYLGSNNGSAYIFKRNGTTWTKEADLLPTAVSGSDYYGYSVDIDALGERAIVGAYNYGSNSWGRCYIYRRDGTTWVEEAVLESIDKLSSGFFGKKVLINDLGNKVLIGAEGVTTYTGAVYEFTRSGNTWTQSNKIQASDKATNDYFGSNIDITPSANVMAVGTYSESTTVTDNGAVYIYKNEFNFKEIQILTATDKTDYDHLGSAVAVSENGYRIIAAAKDEDTTPYSNNGAVYIFVKTNDTWAQEAKLLATERASNDAFGSSVAISGDGTIAIIGSPTEDTTVTDNGAAYIFRYNGTTWVEEIKLLASDKAASDNFGYSVAISLNGLVAIIGSYSEDTSPNSNNGAAYIFRYNGTTWVEEIKLLASDRSSTAQFGASVSISNDGNIAVIGAEYEDIATGNNNGSAYVFRYNGTTWVQESKLTASDKINSERFGHSVSISGNGDLIAVGAPYRSIDPTFENGAVYTYRYNGTTWIEEQKILSGELLEYENFGKSLSIDTLGTKILIGTSSYYTDGDTHIRKGSVYVFKYENNTWVKDIVLTASDIQIDDRYGENAVITKDGNLIVVGSSYKGSGAPADYGAVYIYNKGDIWIEKQKILASDKASSDYFGRSIAISENGALLVIGASSADAIVGTYTDAGIVYLFKNINGVYIEQSIIQASDVEATAYFGYSVAINYPGTIYAVGAPNKNRTLTDVGSTYVFTL